MAGWGEVALKVAAENPDATIPPEGWEYLQGKGGRVGQGTARSEATKGGGVKIIIPDERGPSWNDFYSGGHWSKRKDAKDRARQLVRAYLPPDVSPFTVPVDIFITVYFASRQQDSDNICDKLIIDGLRPWVIPDDDRRYVRWAATRSEIDKHNPRIEIEVVPV